MARKDPLGNFRFRVEIDGLAVAGFSHVVIGATTIDTIDYREGTDPSRVRKLPGLTRYGNVTLTRGVTDSLEFANWQRTVIQGDIGSGRRGIAIVVQDETGADAARFLVSNAWPVGYVPGDLIAKGNDVFIELLELANEGIERVA